MDCKGSWQAAHRNFKTHIKLRSGILGETADNLDHLEKPVYGGPDHAVTGLDADNLDLASAIGPLDSTYDPRHKA